MKDNNPKEDVMFDWENFFNAQELRSWSRTAPLEDDVYEHMARHQNKLLREAIKKHGKKVFKSAGMGHYDKWIEDESELDAAPSHSAILICEKEISGE